MTDLLINTVVEDVWGHIVANDSFFSKTTDKKLVHKEFDENNFVQDVHRINSNDDTDMILTKFNIPSNHKFFFEHPKEHIPGVMLIEAGRQSGTATAHKVYDVGYDQVFILDDMEVKYYDFAYVDKPLYGFNYTYNKVFKRGKLTRMISEGYIMQDGSKVVYMKSSWKIIPQAVIDRMKSRPK